MKLAAVKKQLESTRPRDQAAWRAEAYRAAKVWVAVESDPRPDLILKDVLLRRPGITGAAKPPPVRRAGYDAAGRMVALENLVDGVERNWDYWRWDQDDRGATKMAWHRDTPDVTQIEWFRFDADRRLVECHSVRRDHHGSSSTDREVFVREGDRIMRVEVTEGDLKKWFDVEIVHHPVYDRAGELRQVKTVYDGKPWISYKAAPSKSASKPARKPAAPTKAITKAASSLATAAVRRARAFAKARGEPIGAVALAYSVEGGPPMLGVLCERPTNRDSLNPAEWDGFDEDEDLDLDEVLPASVIKLLDVLDHPGRRALYNQAASAIGATLDTALCYATDLELAELDDNLRAVKAKLPTSRHRRGSRHRQGIQARWRR